MPKKIYTITEQDHRAARLYIQTKLLNNSAWPNADNERVAETFLKSSESPSELNSWCEEWLTAAQWKKLKNALLAARKRERDRKKGQGTKHIDISHDAWRFLSDLAEHEGKTLSEFLVSRLRKEWLDLQIGRIKHDKNG